MRIAFNATALLSPLTGIGQYAMELAQRLAANPEHETHFFYGTGFSREARTEPLPAARHLFPWVRRLVPNSYGISRALQGRMFNKGVRTTGFDLYHDPNYLAYPFRGPTVTTVHDLSWIRFPEAHPVERVRAMNRYFEPVLRRSTLLLTDSDFVKREVMEVFSVPASQIITVPLGVSPLFHPRSADQTRAVLQANGLVHGEYVLAVGTLEPRKNLTSALRAHAALPEAVQQRFPLVLAGLKGWHTDALEKEMAPRVASGRVRLTGYLSRDDLACVIAGACTLVYPSIYEGFGLPPLEAMACGVPTVVSNRASLPEVVGDTGRLVEPDDVDALREAMLEMATAPDVRDQLGAAALARSRRFTWDACMDQTMAAYKAAVARG